MANDVFSIGLIGASDIQDRSCREWPQRMANYLQAGKASRVRTVSMGHEGQSSSTWISDGWHTKMAGLRCDVVLISMFADANTGFALSTATSLANAYTMIDAVRTRRTMPIKMLKMWRMPAATQAATFPNLADYYANYATIAANRSDIETIDCYTAWGDPASNPSEFDPADQIHPLLPGHLRVTIPVVAAAIESLIT